MIIIVSANREADDNRVEEWRIGQFGTARLVGIGGDHNRHAIGRRICWRKPWEDRKRPDLQLDSIVGAAASPSGPPSATGGEGS